MEAPFNFFHGYLFLSFRKQKEEVNPKLPWWVDVPDIFGNDKCLHMDEEEASMPPNEDWNMTKTKQKTEYLRKWSLRL